MDAVPIVSVLKKNKKKGKGGGASVPGCFVFPPDAGQYAACQRCAEQLAADVQDAYGHRISLAIISHEVEGGLWPNLVEGGISPPEWPKR